MILHHKWLAAALAAMMAAAAWTAADASRGAELRLRAQCTARGPVVKLGDVAEIFAADRQQVERLAAIELFPAPLAPQQRFLGVRELQDLLVLRGVNLTEHAFSGSSQITVQSRSPEARIETPQNLAPTVLRKVNQQVCQAVVQYLKEHAAANQPWIVEAQLSEAEARAVADAGRAVTISGGSPPWTGAQQFYVSAAAPKAPLRFPLNAQVTLPASVVVTSRALGRGVVIHAGDVELAPAAPGEHGDGDFHSLAEVVGKETTQAVAAGKPLAQDEIHAPFLVRRGEVVTVYARAAGIRIRTVARSRDNGGEGELVAVESLADRSTFFARVSGIREVEVYARAPRTEAAEREGLGIRE
jgi:flagella basal body P-ring formation protein FlgA